MSMDDEETRLSGSANSDHDSTLQVGQLFGQYRVKSLIGRGGMGEVYRVEHEVLGKEFALKTIRPQILDERNSFERFKREAKVMAQLEHPGIVKVDDFGSQEKITWLRMELIKGGSLDYYPCKTLSSLIERGTPLRPEILKTILMEILEGLAYAHSRGVIHRDLKPGNILVREDGSLKISDFGLVRLAGEEWLQSQVNLTVARSLSISEEETILSSESSKSGTSTKALLGTYEYMSPEQKAGMEVDARSDLYSVGLMAFRLLTGENSIGMDLPSDLVPDLPKEWDNWIRTAISSKRERRFESAREMLRCLPGRKQHATPYPISKCSPNAETEEKIRQESKIQEKQTPDQPKKVQQSNEPQKITSPAAIAELSDKDLKKFYYRSRDINLLGFLAIFHLLSGIFLLLGGLAENDDSLILGGAFVAVTGYLAIRCTRTRNQWHKVYGIIYSILLIPFTLFSVFGIWIFGAHGELFGPNKLEHNDLKAEFKRRGLSAGLFSSGLILPAFALIIIIGLLAAMAIPAFQKVRATSQEKAIINNLRQIASAAQQYMLEEGRYSVRLEDLIGPNAYLNSIEQVADERYPRRVTARDTIIEATLPSGRTVKYEF